MKVFVLDSEKQIGEAAGKIFVDCVKGKPNAALGFATGATPVPTYQYMAQANKAGEVSFKNVTTFNLDEYCDLPKLDSNSYYVFMHKNLFDNLDLEEKNINFLDGNAADAEAESARYAAAIEAAGGIDVQFLGIGRNGHIGFNEPSAEFTNNAFKVTLTQSTIDANSKYFTESEMPHFAMTMGIGSIMRSKKIVFVATGIEKAQAVADMMSGKITPECPASILNAHPDVTVFLDKAAASMLK